MSRPQRRIYPLEPGGMTQEQLAVVFAMTSRRPEPFDQIALQVSREKAAQFHERWVLGYGHASVAEHAVLHLAVEGISRLACDALEDNRLASYTEKSSRFQVLEPGHYFIPPELEPHPPLRERFVHACDTLFNTYHLLVRALQEHLRQRLPPGPGERESAYALRLRRTATDSARFLLPSATLTNVGVTINARALEHAIRKLLSSDLQEEREIGQALKEEGRRVTPTLVRYAERNEYLARTRQARQESAWRLPPSGDNAPQVRLLHYDPQAEERIAIAALYRYSGLPYESLRERVRSMAPEERARLVESLFLHLGPHDAPVRETELVDYTLELVLDYGAYRELKRHRMMTLIPQPLGVELGYVVPPLVQEAGLEGPFREAIAVAEEAHRALCRGLPPQQRRVAEYIVTHAHRRRLLVRLNLRECWHLFRLRTGPQAHFTLREAMERALDLCRGVHPSLFAGFERVRRRS